MKQLFKLWNVPLWIALAATQVLTTLHAADPTSGPGTNVISVLATDPTALIGASTAAFTFVRTGGTNDELTIPFSYSGSAAPATDFAETDSDARPGGRSIRIHKGLYATDLVIQPKFNPGLRGNKTVDVTLDPALASGLLSIDPKHNQAEVRIVDDIFNDSPPFVSLTTPVENSTWNLPTTLVITADASDVDDEIQKVSFYANDSFLGAAVSSPFAFKWVNPRPGDYDLFARAVDEAGKSTLSQPIRVHVTGVLPTVTITSPADKSTFPALASVPINVSVTGIGGLSVRLLYDGSNVLADLIKAPYQMTWVNVPSGKHTITARVTDLVQQTATASVQFTVADQSPVVKITSPTSGSNFTQGNDIVLTARATAPGSSVKDVTFWVNRRILGKGTVSSTDPAVYLYTWSDAKPNFYLIQATATNTNGTEGSSDAVYISVSQH